MELPMEVEKILTLLPHRYPFMLVDRIVEYSAEENRIVGLKNLTFNEPFFQGHFPGSPVMPGVLQLEAMAQVAGVMLNLREGNEGKIAYFMSINQANIQPQKSSQRCDILLPQHDMPRPSTTLPTTRTHKPR